MKHAMHPKSKEMPMKDKDMQKMMTIKKAPAGQMKQMMTKKMKG